MPRATTLALLAAAAAASACARYGMVDDGTTVAFGRSFAGSLHNGAQLPPRGDGYHVPRRWVRRGNQYGTDELVSMVVRVARRVEREAEGSSLGVADLSPERGGATLWHRSHQSGRDVDLLMFAVDRKGRRLESDAMVRYRDDGSSRPIDSHGNKVSKRYFDVERNWVLIRALLEEPTVEIQFIYVYGPLRQLLIDYAREHDEPEGLVEYAAAVLQEPVESSAHDDHFHVRIYCPEDDRELGCEDGFVRPWHKKLYKYGWGAIVARARLVALALSIVRMFEAG